MEKLKPGRPKMLNTDKFILSCGLCKGKVYNPNSKRAYCEGRCKNRDIQDWYYLLDGAVYYNKYTREEYTKLEKNYKEINEINKERYKINLIKQKIMAKRIQVWVKKIIYKRRKPTKSARYTL